MLTSYRESVLKKIEEYEKLGLFDKDCEDDPPSSVIKQGEVDYLHKKLSTKIKSHYANRFSFRFFNKLIKQGAIVIDDIVGIENLMKVKGGAIVTANHFNPFDSIPIHKVLKKYKKKYMYTIIKEGNWFYPGLYGKFFRNCNTIPLSSDLGALKDMFDATNTLLKNEEYILIYPEQSLWWNYRKPKPLKPGAFQFAIKANVPVIPTFITMRDTDKLDGDGLPIQAYTLHILPVIYPDKYSSKQENVNRMSKENFDAWKEVYERVYGIPLTYTTEK